jgi:hypothetical protein
MFLKFAFLVNVVLCSVVKNFIFKFSKMFRYRLVKRLPTFFPKRRWIFSSQYGITFQKTWVLIHIAVRTTNLLQVSQIMEEVLSSVLSINKDGSSSTLLHGEWRQSIPPKCWCLCTRPHCVTSAYSQSCGPYVSQRTRVSLLFATAHRCNKCSVS